MIEVEATGAESCSACGAFAQVQYRASNGGAAARGAQRVWTSSAAPATFRIRRWSRGEQPRIVLAGEFSSWPALVELAREVGR